MQIAILSCRKKLYSTQRLMAEAIQRGYNVEVINTLRCYMNINAQDPSMHYKGKKLANFDAVIPRIGASITFYGAAVLRQFEMMGVTSLNSSIAITRSRDKLRAMQLLSRRGIGLPVTGFADSPDDIDDLINMVGGAPLIIKMLEGTQGIGVMLAETLQAARSSLAAFMGMKASIMAQEYIKEAEGADIRCFVIDGKVIAAMKRQAQAGEFRSNIHQGGAANLIEINDAERDMAIRATRILGLNVAGVDLLRSNRGPLVMEVNSSPGLKGIESVTGLNIAGMIIDFAVQQVKQSKKRRVKNRVVA